VILGARGRLSLGRVKPADPSFRNWPALDHAVGENTVPDFPLGNKSSISRTPATICNRSV